LRDLRGACRAGVRRRAGLLDVPPEARGGALRVVGHVALRRDAPPPGAALTVGTLRGMVPQVDRPFDADNHYYEALDAFTRHLDPAWGPRCVQWAEIDGRKYHVVGGRVSRAVVNPTFDPVAKPGVLKDYFRGNPHGDDPLELLKARDPISPAYRDRDARLATLDVHGLDKVWMFPTLGMIYESLLV